jgi:hypothetical protein
MLFFYCLDSWAKVKMILYEIKLDALFAIQCGLFLGIQEPVAFVLGKGA